MNKFQTLATAFACIATIVLASSAVAMSPSTSIANATATNLNAIASQAGFAIVDFEVQSNDQVITPFGDDVVADETHAAEMIAVVTDLEDCLHDCLATTKTRQELIDCEQACHFAFPHGLSRK